MPRHDVNILGRTIGTASGWDGEPGECYWFEGFQPKDGVDLPAGDLQVDETKGIIGVQNPENGEIINPQDICVALINIPKG